MTDHNLSRAEDMKREFDRGFAVVHERAEARTEDLLAIGLFGAKYALRLQDVAGLSSNKKITRIPAARPGLLGIAGFRGRILPVYDLGALIGLPGSVTPRWLAVARSGDVAVAFEAFDGHLRVPAGSIAANEYKDGGRQYLSHLIRSEDGIRSIVNLENALKTATT